MRVRLPSGARFARDAWLLIAVSGVLSVSFYGIHNLLRVFYVLRLGHGPEYVGLYSASSALTYMAMGLPSGALGQRYGTRRIMLLAIVIVVLGMIALPLTEVLPTALHAAWPIISQIILTSGWSMINVNIIPGLVTATAPESRGSVYALNGAVRGVGTLVGTLVGGLLPGFFAGLFGQTLDAATPYGYSLWVGAAVSIVAIVPIALLRPARPSATASSGADTTDPFPIAPMALLAGHIFLVHGGWATLQAFGNAAYGHRPAPHRLGHRAHHRRPAQLVSTGAALVTPRLVRRAGDGATLILSAWGWASACYRWFSSPLVDGHLWACGQPGPRGDVAAGTAGLPDGARGRALALHGLRHRQHSHGVELCFVSLAGVHRRRGGYRAVFLGRGCVAASVIHGRDGEGGGGP